MKLKEMLKERERLREIDRQLKGYDNFKSAIEELKRVYADNVEPYECESYPYDMQVCSRNGERRTYIFPLKSDTLRIIINALQAEIDKIEQSDELVNNTINDMSKIEVGDYVKIKKDVAKSLFFPKPEYAYLTYVITEIINGMAVAESDYEGASVYLRLSSFDLVYKPH